MNKFLEELKWREILNNVTNETKLTKAMENNMGAYIGFDPSADSLHLGNYVMIMMLRRLKQFNIEAYAVIGGATGMIGDPSGKSSERNLLDKATLEHNKVAIRKQLEKYGKAKVLDNFDNFKNMNYLDFLRDIGKMINVNYMLEKDIIKSRLETGISYTEFSYTLIQAYDFLKYYQDYNIAIQLGGSDQWGNITTGCEMIRKATNDNNFGCGVTINLLLKSDGKKFGKSEKGAIFLDPKKTSPYAMYQFLINQTDGDVIKLLKFFTMLNQKEINEIEAQHQKEPFRRIAQKKLAELIVKDIHGEAQLNKVIETSRALFSGDIIKIDHTDLKIALEAVPTTVLKEKQIDLIDLLILSNICSSKRQGRELIKNNSIKINGIKQNNEFFKVSKSDALNHEFSVLQKGKKNYYMIQFILS